MKKTIVIFLCAIMLLGVSGCKPDNSQQPGTETNQSKENTSNIFTKVESDYDFYLANESELLSIKNDINKSALNSNEMLYFDKHSGELFSIKKGSFDSYEYQTLRVMGLFDNLVVVNLLDDNSYNTVPSFEFVEINDSPALIMRGNILTVEKNNNLLFVSADNPERFVDGSAAKTIYSIDLNSKQINEIGVAGYVNASSRPGNDNFIFIKNKIYYTSFSNIYEISTDLKTVSNSGITFSGTLRSNIITDENYIYGLRDIDNYRYLVYWDQDWNVVKSVLINNPTPSDGYFVSYEESQSELYFKNKVFYILETEFVMRKEDEKNRYTMIRTFKVNSENDSVEAIVDEYPSGVYWYIDNIRNSKE